MSANKIAETSTSSGTGDFTLAGAWSVPDSFITGNRTFNSFYGLNHRFPYMIQDKLGNWEKGVGYLSGAAVLVRETVVDNSLTTTALINFPAGEKLVMVPTDAGSDWPYKIPANNAILTGHQFGVSAGALAMVADRVVLTPFLAKRPIVVSGFMMDITTVAAGTIVRGGIYSISTLDLSDASLSLVSTQAVVDSGSGSGSKEFAVNATLGAGLYMIALVSDGTPSMRVNNSAHLDLGLTNSATALLFGSFRQDISNASLSLPSLITGAISGFNAGTVRCPVKARFL